MPLNAIASPSSWSLLPRRAAVAGNAPTYGRLRLLAARALPKLLHRADDKKCDDDGVVAATSAKWTESEMTMPASHHKEKTTFLTFGDGDFSYSLDMAKYLASSKEQSYRVIATGIDSLEELNAKYRDAPFLLQQLQSLNQDSFSVTVRHGINAVQPPPPSTDEQWKAHHVIFNHPHVGTEDAALHGRFLSHFLHTASLSWMSVDGGILHLTLVKGQYERWKCEEAAARHCLMLLERNAFVPPPASTGKAHYQHRRHQTGKSFASRATGGSETLTFGRIQDKGRHVATHLPWQRHVTEEPAHPVYPCPHCTKSFREERSRKSHIKAVHSSSDSDKKRKRVQSLECVHCKALNLVRLFPHDQALQDHVRAKHDSIYSTIQPDWAEINKKHSSSISEHCDSTDTQKDEQVQDEPHECCTVCGLIYQKEKDEANHLKEFIPVPVSELDLEDTTSCTYPCSFCNKSFRDQRAQRQHENACVTRLRSQTEPANNSARQTSKKF